MELSDAVAKRRSVRTYKKQELSQGTMEILLEAARLAPSAGNIQPWAFVVASNQKTKLDLSQAAFGQRSLQDASAVIVVCADEKRAVESYGNRGKTLYCIQDTAAAIQNILLTACSMGLGTCWVGAFKEDEVRKVVKTPQKHAPCCVDSCWLPH